MTIQIKQGQAHETDTRHRLPHWRRTYPPGDAGFPQLHGRSMAEQRDELRELHDPWRRACLLEPRGNDVLVGALYCPPVSADATCGVIFFNNAGYLNMCGHGTIGLVASLQHLGLIAPGVHKIDTRSAKSAPPCMKTAPSLSPTCPPTATASTWRWTCPAWRAWRHRLGWQLVLPGCRTRPAH